MEYLDHPLINDLFDYIHNFEWVQGQTPLTSTMTPVIASLVYIAGLFIIPRIMAKREPIQLKALCALHNLILSLWSLAMFTAVCYYIGLWMFRKGFVDVVCDPRHVGGKGPHVFWYYIFYLSKFYEFLDTLFQLLRKKKPIFLHTYHHVITLWLCWICMNAVFSIQFVDIAANASVHIVMYYYYYLSEKGINVWWKKYITKIQITQFVIDISMHAVWYYYYHHNYNCSGNMTVFWFGNYVIGSFLALFIKFYYDSYKRNANAKRNIKQA